MAEPDQQKKAKLPEPPKMEREVMAGPKREFNAKEEVNKMIKVLSDSIQTEQAEYIERQPIGRSDTYWMRNTLKSMLKYGHIK